MPVDAPQDVAGIRHSADDLALPGRADWQITLTGLDGLPRLRRKLQEWGESHQTGPLAGIDVTLAVSEIATNGLVHGQPPVGVHAWRYHDALVVQVDDRGGTPLPATAGRRPPGPVGRGHFGLWLACRLARSVRTHTTAALTSVRLCFPTEPVHHRQPPARPGFGPPGTGK